MAKLIQYIIRLILVTSLILVLVSITNFTNLKYNYLPDMKMTLNKYDIINNWFSEAIINDITYLFKQKQIAKTVREIIVHHDAIDSLAIEGNPIIAINNYHKFKMNEDIAYHYFIDKNGNIYQLHYDNARTHHCNGKTDTSIGICLAGNFDIEKPTQKQIESLVKLLVQLSIKYRHSLNDIHPHSDFGNTSCPGKNVDMYVIKRSVANYHFINELIQKINE